MIICHTVEEKGAILGIGVKIAQIGQRTITTKNQPSHRQANCVMNVSERKRVATARIKYKLTTIQAEMNNAVGSGRPDSKI